MGATRNAKRPDGGRVGSAASVAGSVIEAAMLAFLVGLALAFVASAPS